MKTCSKCGKINSSESRFCVECGIDFMQTFKACSKCGIEYLNGENFCSVCGGKVENAVISSKGATDILNLIKIPGKNFYMLSTPVTQELYMNVMGENPSFFQKEMPEQMERFKSAWIPVCDGENYLRRPVECVNWYETLVFCNKLSKLKGLNPCYKVNGSYYPDFWGSVPDSADNLWTDIECDFSANGYRLPLAEEWEYASLGGKDADCQLPICKVGWYSGNSNGSTHEVCQMIPNDYGLYDMRGNVLEWCWDSFNETTKAKNVCGGCYGFSDFRCTATSRDGIRPFIKLLGFRIVTSYDD